MADRFHLVGHDYGAVVAWQVAARHQHRLLSMTALSVPHPVAYLEAYETSDQQARSGYFAWFRRSEHRCRARRSPAVAPALSRRRVERRRGRCVLRGARLTRGHRERAQLVSRRILLEFLAGAGGASVGEGSTPARAF